MNKGFERQLGHSKLKAVAQFKQLERKLEKYRQLCEKYNHFMNEYIAMNHMKPAVETNSLECYLPHHGVLKFESNSTKLQAVFNASEKKSTGFSLKDLMECGSKLQRDILELLLSWRAYKYVYKANCEKMYLMIKVQEDVQQLHKIMWRNEQGAMQDFQSCTVTYGMKAAPYLALRTMQQSASDDADVYPIATEILKKRLYVDDLIYGSNKIEKAKQAQRKLIDILRESGFNLRKRSSNEPRLLKDLSNDQINVSTVNFNNCSSSSTKALGLRWHLSCDIFTFDNKIENTQKPDTKRSILSNISKLFDALCWLSPSTIKAKLLFQRLWSEHKEWDQSLSPDIQHEWSKLKEELMNISKIKIPRWVSNTQSSVHGYADASEKAYATEVYIKTYKEDKEPRINLIAAKTKLAPQKKRITFKNILKKIDRLHTNINVF
ncbi:unnamed protein product [Parnassius mnemosyne]|uniref:Reverse transcriptase domain-containing protein n=1 Tax=Parnassius mnemosyne TaxID=213953 RepID=A0AAV1LBG2_9NEOP